MPPLSGLYKQLISAAVTREYDRASISKHVAHAAIAHATAAAARFLQRQYFERKSEAAHAAATVA